VDILSALSDASRKSRPRIVIEERHLPRRFQDAEKCLRPIAVHPMTIPSTDNVLLANNTASRPPTRAQDNGLPLHDTARGGCRQQRYVRLDIALTNADLVPIEELTRRPSYKNARRRRILMRRANPHLDHLQKSRFFFGL